MLLVSFIFLLVISARIRSGSDTCSMDLNGTGKFRKRRKMRMNKPRTRRLVRTASTLAYSRRSPSSLLEKQPNMGYIGCDDVRKRKPQEKRRKPTKDQRDRFRFSAHSVCFASVRNCTSAGATVRIPLKDVFRIFPLRYFHLFLHSFVLCTYLSSER